MGSEFPAPGESPPDGLEEGEVRLSSPGKLGSDMMAEMTLAAAATMIAAAADLGV